MVNKTTNLLLTLPGNNELQDVWDEPVNENFTIIDEFAGEVETKLQDMAFEKTSPAEFLAVAHNSDGSLKATDEIVQARNSFLFGDEDIVGNPVLLAARINAIDNDIHTSREGMSSHREMTAFRFGNQSMVMEGSKDANGYPKWAGFTGKNVNIDGSLEDIWMMVGGKLGRVRNQKQVTIDNTPFGTKYIYASLNEVGEVVATGTTGAGGEDGSGGKIRLFEDINADFSTVKAGDILTITGTTVNSRRYLIKEVVSSKSVRIMGVFVSAMANMSYEIRDPVAMSFGFDSVKNPSKFYTVEADWDGSSVTALRTIHFSDTFVGEWRSVDVNVGLGTFNETWQHNLFSDVLDVMFQVSKKNDGTEPVETLSNCLVDNDFVVDTQSSIGGAGVTGGVSSNLSGSAYPSKSVMYQFTKNKIDVANAKPGVFYTNFSGAKITSGYIRVVIKCLSKR